MTVKSRGGSIVKSRLITKLNPIALVIPIAYDKDEAYGLGDIVYITDALNPAGLNIHSGIWLCVQNIPSNKFTGTDKPEGSPYKRYSDVNYYPQWPMPDEDSLDARGDKKIYWLLISLYPMEMAVCEDNVRKTYYVSASEKSGSLP
jgi:hypothetical protein